MQTNAIGGDRVLREYLKTIPNPKPKLDYLTALSESVNGRLTVSITYVPDKLLLPPTAFTKYLAKTSEHLVEPLEACAHMLLEDFNNEVVPRWVRISLVQARESAPGRHVILVDQQPRWSNTDLISNVPADVL